jgi:hypothetical protein
MHGVLRSLAVVAGVVFIAAASVAAVHLAPPRLFETGDACMACHNVLSTSTGEDISIGTSWRASMMANSARDPYWQASVRREVLDHPEAQQEIEDECSTCHMPMMRAQERAEGRHGEVLSRLPLGNSDEDSDLLAADGVSCTVCHQIQDTKLGSPESFNGRFSVDTTTEYGKRAVFGPHEIDRGRRRIMHSSSEFVPTQGLHIRKSELCATCHTLYTTARDASGRAVGRLPEQVPFLEWTHSTYDDGEQARSCQSCHMPVVAESTAIAGVWGQPRPGLARHDFRGGNFFMLRMLNRYRAELAVQALPQELDAAAERNVTTLRTATATLALENVRVAGGRVLADVAVQNLTGHKLPTAYPSRRAWLHVTVRDANGRVVFESGAMRPDGSIAGNDADADATKYEPHFREIARDADVQIYESVMVDPADRVTTGLLSAVRYIKDNRLLPTGFDKASAGPDIAVHGEASGDADFGSGGDRVRYSIDVSRSVGPFRVEAELLYQPIGFRWARNLRSARGAQTAAEIDRFTGYYDAMAHGSAAPLAQATATAR